MEDLWIITGLVFQLVCKFEKPQNKMLEVGAKKQTVDPELRKQTQPAAEALPGSVAGPSGDRAESLLEAVLLALAQAGEGRRARGWGPSCSPTSSLPPSWKGQFLRHQGGPCPWGGGSKEHSVKLTAPWPGGDHGHQPLGTNMLLFSSV